MSRVVKVKGWSGVAFHVLGPELVEMVVEDLDEDVVELVPSENNVRVVMVGDDKVHVVDKDDCTDLKDDEYCYECGQIGCHWSHL